MIDSYRLDNRTVDQYERDMKDSHVIERDIIHRYSLYLFKRYKKTIRIQNNGCDNSGKLLSKEEVNTKADFILNGKPFEVKFNRDMLDAFHFKVGQAESYASQRAFILWCNGYNTARPKFAIINPFEVKQIVKFKPRRFFPEWQKDVFQLKTDDYKWFRLP